jgi:hypothetical protein
VKRSKDDGRIVLLRAALPIVCPACGGQTPWQRATVDVPFLCPRCGRSIQVKHSYFRALGFLSFPIAGLLAYAMGARRDVLVWSTLLGGLPMQFIMSFMTMRLFPPQAELTGDYRSILHPVDPSAVERVAREDARHDESED